MTVSQLQNFYEAMDTKFKKGCVSWNKGKKMSEATRQKISNSKKGSTPWNKGKTGIYTKEQIEKLRKSSIDRKIKPPSFLGKNHSKATKEKMSISRKGEKSHMWIKDRTKLKGHNSEERRSSAYNNWRREVWKRDNWKCKMNNSDCNGRLEAHHILGFTKYPELRYDINNGITLCHFHHPFKKQDEINLSPYFKELVMNIR